MLAHELRNPLAPISNAVRALRLSPSQDPATSAAAGMLDRQVGQMARLVDDLLDMSRITRGKIELRRQRVELRSIVEQAVDAVRASYLNLHHELTVTQPSEPIYLDADPARIAQIIGNLLNNAGKFTDRGGVIALSVARSGDQVVITVRDNGIGIDPDDLPRVFDMFAQVDTSLERSRDGLGIGLTLVKTLTEMHGGTVIARSDGRGRGSTFSVTLPMAATDLSVPVSAPLTKAGPVPSSRRVLIVDDNPDGAESLALLLEFSGYEVHRASDGEEGLVAAHRLQPDVVLLDIGLPRLNGYEVCARLRQSETTRDLMLIALTGWGQEEDRTRSRAAGFDAHLVKPVDHDRLLALLAIAPRRDAPATGRSAAPTADQ
jgi:CheY-like chemotaxis protein/two-component sensor histidine kinase